MQRAISAQYKVVTTFNFCYIHFHYQKRDTNTNTQVDALWQASFLKFHFDGEYYVSFPKGFGYTIW